MDVAGKLSCGARIPQIVQQISENMKKRLASYSVTPQTPREQMIWQYAATIAKLESERVIWPHYGQEFTIPKSILGRRELHKLRETVDRQDQEDRNSPEIPLQMAQIDTCSQENDEVGETVESETKNLDMSQAQWVNLEDWLRHQTAEYYKLLLTQDLGS